MQLPGVPIVTDVDLSLGDIVLDGYPAPPPPQQKGHSHPPSFGPCLLRNSQKTELPRGTSTNVV